MLNVAPRPYFAVHICIEIFGQQERQVVQSGVIRVNANAKREGKREGGTKERAASPPPGLPYPEKERVGGERKRERQWDSWRESEREPPPTLSETQREKERDSLLLPSERERGKERERSPQVS